jgi:predicted dehydrogenase
MLGAGFIGQMHSLAFGGVGLSKQERRATARLVALADRNPGLLAEVRERYGWEQSDPDWRAAIEIPGVDMFINSGPNDAHAEPTIEAAKRGKPILCEKPLARSADEAFSIWQAVQDAGVVHMCAFVHRFIPALQLARRLIADGEIGRVRHFRSNFLIDMQHPGGALSWRYSKRLAGGGATADLGSHHIDQARFLVGEVTRVSALMSSWSKDTAGQVDDVNDDWFAAAAELENGATAVFEASRLSEGHPLTGRIEVDGTLGTLRWEMSRVSELHISEPRKGQRTLSVVAPDHPYSDFWLPVGIQGSFAIGWKDAFFHQARHMLNAVAFGDPVGPLGATFEDGYRVAEIVEAVQRSAQNGSVETVRFREVR